MRFPDKNDVAREIDHLIDDEERRGRDRSEGHADQAEAEHADDRERQIGDRLDQRRRLRLPVVPGRADERIVAVADAAEEIRQTDQRGKKRRLIVRVGDLRSVDLDEGHDQQPCDREEQRAHRVDAPVIQRVKPAQLLPFAAREHVAQQRLHARCGRSDELLDAVRHERIDRIDRHVFQRGEHRQNHHVGVFIDHIGDVLDDPARFLRHDRTVDGHGQIELIVFFYVKVQEQRTQQIDQRGRQLHELDGRAADHERHADRRVHEQCAAVDEQLYAGFLIGVQQQLIGDADEILPELGNAHRRDQSRREPVVERVIDERRIDRQQNRDIACQNAADHPEKALGIGKDPADLRRVAVGQRLIIRRGDDRADAEIADVDEGQKLRDRADKAVDLRAVKIQKAARQDQAGDDQDHLIDQRQNGVPF